MINKFDYHYPPEGLDEYIHNKTNILARYEKDFKKIIKSKPSSIVIIYNEGIKIQLIDKKHNVSLEIKFKTIDDQDFYANLYYLFNLINFAGENWMGKRLYIEGHTKYTTFGISSMSYKDLEYEKYRTSLIKEMIRLCHSLNNSMRNGDTSSPRRTAFLTFNKD